MKQSVDYSTLTKADFDAIVTGELVHISIFLELQINNFLSYYFTYRGSRKDDFRSLILHRACLTFQDKIDIVKAVLNKYYPKVNKQEATSILNRVEELKSIRNIFSHGFASFETSTSDTEVSVVMTTHSGKLKTVTITPDNHKEKLKEYNKLMKDLTEWKIRTIKLINTLKE